MWARSDGRFEKSVLQVYNRMLLIPRYMTNYIFSERLLPVEHGKNARRMIIKRVASKVIRSVSITSGTPLPYIPEDRNNPSTTLHPYKQSQISTTARGRVSDPTKTHLNHCHYRLQHILHWFTSYQITVVKFVFLTRLIVHY